MNANDSMVSNLREIVKKAQQENRMNEILQVIAESNGSGAAASSSPVPDQLMMPIKRTRDGEWDVVPEQLQDGGLSQAPMAPRTTAPSSGRGYVPIAPPPFPDGITSIEHWGRTRCELPKVAKLRASYVELVTRSQTDSDLHTYLLRYVMKHNGPSPKVRDLRKYLEYINFGCDQPQTYLAGSTTEVRKFK